MLISDIVRNFTQLFFKIVVFMKNQVKVIVGFAAGLAIGMCAGYILPENAVGENGSGDISKVSKFSKVTVSPQASAYQEKIMNDPEALEQAYASLTVMCARMDDFKTLVDFAISSSEGIGQLSCAVARLETARTLAQNASDAAHQAVSSFALMKDGASRTSASDYESASQNLSLAYMMVDRQVSIGKEYVAAVDSYMKDRKVEDNVALSYARDLWAGYCAGQAVLNNDSDALSYWVGRDALIDSGNLAQVEALRANPEISGFQGIPETAADINDLFLCAAENNALGCVVASLGLASTLGFTDKLSLSASVRQALGNRVNELGNDISSASINDDLLGNVSVSALGNVAGLSFQAR